jgi:hypothetical protein
MGKSRGHRKARASGPATYRLVFGLVRTSGLG